MKDYILEGCVDSVESAIIAGRGGCNRLELCSNLIIGGTTPGRCLYDEVRKNCNIKVHALIRPRFGDFCYSEHEFNVIKEEVKMFRELGADGVVIGILRPEGSLNMEQMAELMELTGDMSVTLHRAFDVCRNPFETMKEAIKLGINTILTSGQKNSCQRNTGIPLVRANYKYIMHERINQKAKPGKKRSSRQEFILTAIMKKSM